MHAARLPLLLALVLACAGCGRPGELAVLPTTRAGIEGVDLADALSRLNLVVLTAVPSPLLGPYVAGYLALTGGPPYRGALEGIEAQSTFQTTQSQQDEEVTTVLSNLGSALEADIRDLLNRSQNREQTLNEYIRSLRFLLEAGGNQRQALTERLSALSEERRQSRRKAADLQHELNQALRERNYSVAGSRQEELAIAEREVAEHESRERHLQSLIDITEDFVEVGAERLTAIEENRSALIAGVQVIEVPGIEDIGVLKTSRRRRSRGVTESMFDPGPLGGQ